MGFPTHWSLRLKACLPGEKRCCYYVFYAETLRHFETYIRKLPKPVVPWNTENVNYMSRIIIRPPEALRGSIAAVCHFVCLRSRKEGETEPKGHPLDDKTSLDICTRACEGLFLHAEDMKDFTEEPETNRLQYIMSTEGM